ncbi:phage tail protein [Sphingomonas sp.]|uniref:phage tail protein n=1 Tax=Sphingomonas sp. TaxID=28214 RepID=UPI002ED82828
MILMSLGMFAFHVSTLAHDELQRRADWRHERSKRIGARDAFQFVGPGDESVTISGSSYAELSDGRASIDELREMAGSGEYWPLVDGAGRVFGDFAITALDERHKHLFDDGTPRRIDFALDLVRVDSE